MVVGNVQASMKDRSYKVEVSQYSTNNNREVEC